VNPREIFARAVRPPLSPACRGCASNLPLRWSHHSPGINPGGRSYRRTRRWSIASSIATAPLDACGGDGAKPQAKLIGACAHTLQDFLFCAVRDVRVCDKSTTPNRRKP